MRLVTRPRARRRPHRSVLALATSAVLLAGCGGTPGDAAATVNGRTVTESELELMVRSQVEDPQGPVAGLEGDQRNTQIAEVQRQVLTQLIRLELVSQVAEERGITVSEEEVEERWQREIAFQGDEETLRELIASLGLTEEQAREQLAAQVQQDKLRESVAESVEVTDEELRELYESRSDQNEQAEVSHILVADEAEANAIIDLLEQGEPFEELATARSLDEGSAVQGGNLGVRPRGSYVEPFDEAVWNAEEGEIVGPVETQFGYHVIRVEEFRTNTFDDLEESLRDELRSQRADDAFRELVSDLFADADVSVDSRFGEWDPATGQVVVADRLAPRSDPQVTEPVAP